MGWTNSGWRSSDGGWYKNAVVGGAAVTWNPADKDAGITLSSGNLVMTNNTGSAFSSVRGTTSHSSGKYYFEYTFTTQNFASFSGFGLANSTAPLNAAISNSTNGLIARGNGQVDINNSSIGAWTGGGVSGAICALAVDFTAQKIWIWESTTGNWNADILANQNPATGTGGYSIAGLAAGPYYPAAHIWQLNDVSTVNFGGSAYTGSLPSGFSNW